MIDAARDLAMTAYIASAIASSTPVEPDVQTMYLLYLPPGRGLRRQRGGNARGFGRE